MAFPGMDAFGDWVSYAAHPIPKPSISQSLAYDFEKSMKEEKLPLDFRLNIR